MIRVLKPGFFSTIQDRGRFGYQQYGVIVSGAMDQVAYAIGNALLQQKDEAAIEMTLVGGTFEFTESTTIALTGGDMQAMLNHQRVAMNKAIAVQKGDVLTCGAIRQGVRSYLCVKGGIDVPVVMDSRSTYLKAGIGGMEGRVLQKDDTLAYEPSNERVRKVRLCTTPFYKQAPIRILEGTEWAFFDEATQRALLNASFTISLESDRMGYRLIPEKRITIPSPHQMISEAVTFGTIQMPPNGEPIILMADRQTTGGYPKIGQVITADLHRLAQLPPQTRITFEMVTMHEAENAARRLHQQLQAVSWLCQ